MTFLVVDLSLSRYNIPSSSTKTSFDSIPSKKSFPLPICSPQDNAKQARFSFPKRFILFIQLSLESSPIFKTRHHHHTQRLASIDESLLGSSRLTRHHPHTQRFPDTKLASIDPEPQTAARENLYPRLKKHLQIQLHNHDPVDPERTTPSMILPNLAPPIVGEIEREVGELFFQINRQQNQLKHIHESIEVGCMMKRRRWIGCSRRCFQICGGWSESLRVAGQRRRTRGMGTLRFR